MTDQHRKQGLRITRRETLAAGVGIVAGIGLAGIYQSRFGGTQEPVADTPRDRSGVDSDRPTELAFFTTGAAFSPVVELNGAGAKPPIWLDESGTELARGAAPTIDFGSEAPRKVVMRAQYDEVLTINVGFSAEDDVGDYSLDASFDKAPEALTTISGLALLTNLRRLLAAHTDLEGPLDLRGMARLEHVEIFRSHVDAIDLAGCDALIRLCVEENALTSLDLNPVSATLRDLRAAAQTTQHLALEPLASPMPQLQHFCVRGQEVTGHPSADQLPVCKELWNWSSNQEGALPTPGAATSVLAAGNAYETADLQGQWQYDGGWGTLDLTDNNLTSLSVEGCHALQTLRLGGNSLEQESVDTLLAEVASWGTEGFELIVDGTNAPPSTAGLQHAQELQGRGWTVQVS